MGNYYVIVTCRNSEDTIEKAILSLHNQTIKPEYIITIDDGSTDRTPEILKRMSGEMQNLFVITNPDMGYDVTRIVKNWNKAIQFSREHNLKPTDYHMIGTDDTIYEQDYAEKIISLMDNNQDLAIVSGRYDENRYEKPHGAGRFVRNSFFNNAHYLYPEKMGYESVVLITALKAKMRYMILRGARFEHTRPLGQNHHFYEFGASMRTLGYHPLFAFGRFLKYFITGKPIGRMGALYMIYHYISYKPKETGYDSMYPEDIRKYLRQEQIDKIKSVLRIK
ncbi:glycosyltransferase family A protein [Candidatus Nitrosocosmicus franklandus]|uniref:Poly-beta-1,6-N-acetyl-D-glucosamine synthase n=1 Tax=Candidatus Nitrosocosmicus franklandianus TaxID=1798806 RepID=A0A484IH70_9ARCH|nr:glycosyltransferase family A protein [Candidatus Nitrosocosmicus franklandus]VFJ15004.1 Poly-beta-1,6-N-acetyl-D-glucosamine synthase [Candidatus Nitrosocosmicus franklandus]